VDDLGRLRHMRRHLDAAQQATLEGSPVPFISCIICPIFHSALDHLLKPGRAGGRP
jgi:hypothetical protein